MKKNAPIILIILGFIAYQYFKRTNETAPVNKRKSSETAKVKKGNKKKPIAKRIKKFIQKDGPKRPQVRTSGFAKDPSTGKTVIKLGKDDLINLYNQIADLNEKVNIQKDFLRWRTSSMQARPAKLRFDADRALGARKEAYEKLSSQFSTEKARRNQLHDKLYNNCKHFGNIEKVKI